MTIISVSALQSAETAIFCDFFVLVYLLPPLQGPVSLYHQMGIPPVNVLFERPFSHYISLLRIYSTERQT